jgi:hypothetical protein
MAKSSAAPLLIVGGAALLLMSGSKKKKSGSKPPAYGPGLGGDDPMAPSVYPGAGPTPGPTPGSSKPKPSTDEETWIMRQANLISLGYDEVGTADGVPGANTVKGIKLFQTDWNWFVDYLGQINPETNYSAPYTKISVDGKWGPATESRVNKAIGRFDGIEPVYVEELDREANDFRDMINGLKNL